MIIILQIANICVCEYLPSNVFEMYLSKRTSSLLLKKQMTSLWVIVRSEDTDPDPDYSPDEPTVCGIYASREEAVEEILKLYIEDDIDLVEKSSSVETPGKDVGQENKPIEPVEAVKEIKPVEVFDYRPTPDSVRLQRGRLLEDEYNTYTNRGNVYTLIECVLGAKHEFEEDVLEMYQQSL